MFPVCLGLTISIIGEIRDEFRRFVNDYKINSREIKVFDSDSENLGINCKVKSAGSLRVGDIVCLDEGDIAPADLLILHTWYLYTTLFFS